MEAGLLQVTAPDPDNNSTRLEQASNAGLIGALVVHVNAGMSFRPLGVLPSDLRI